MAANWRCPSIQQIETAVDAQLHQEDAFRGGLALRRLLPNLIVVCAFFFACACDGRKVAAAAEDASCEAPSDPIFIQGGRFTMGSDATYTEEGPAREVGVSGFWMSHRFFN